MNRVLVIVVTFNGERFLEKCLSPLKSTEVDCLVIDNASTDKTKEILKEKYFHIPLIENEKNLGFGAANNMGFRYAFDKGYEYIYLLNQDAWIDSGDILKLITLADAKRNYGILSPLQVYPDGVTPDGKFSNCFSAELHDILSGGKASEQIYPVKKGGMLQAAHWLVRMCALKEVGGFSPVFFHYGEDKNLCYRMRYRGWELGVVPSVKGVHDRAHRVETKKQILYLELQKWKNALSDPTKEAKERRNHLYILMKESARSNKLSVIPNVFKLLKQLPTIKKNYRQSLSEGAFLS